MRRLTESPVPDPKRYTMYPYDVPYIGKACHLYQPREVKSK